jgi:ATP-dependent Clp protease, protease subunit
MSSRLDQEDEKAGPEAAAPAIVEKALFKSRVVLLTGEVNDVQARRVTERLLALAGDSDDPITLVVSSPGGHVESGDMIHDIVGFIKPKVNMLGAGWVASAGALIYCAVPKAQRFCLPNTRFLLHEPRGGIGGMASDIEIQAREIIRMRERLNKIFADATGQTIEQVKKDTDRDHWMLPSEALAYGLVGKVVRTAAEIG